MDGLDARRKRLFRGAPFASALLYNGDKAHGASASFRYFSGCGVDGCYLLLKKNSGLLFTHEMNIHQARQECRYPAKLLGKEGLKILGKEAGRGRVGFDAGEVSAARRDALVKRGKLKLIDAGERMQQARSGKSPGEVAALAASAKIARKILEELDPWGCRTEIALAGRLKMAALDAGAEISFEPIVATGKNSRFPHHSPTSARLGDFVLVDFGVKYRDYCSDFTRCYFRKRGMKEREAYGKCIAVFEEMLRWLPGCRTGRDVAELSGRLVKKHGLPPMIHSIGHGIGLEVHECPHLWGKSNDLVKNSVLAIEPAAYFDSFGVRFEEMAVNAGKGWKRL